MRPSDLAARIEAIRAAYGPSWVDADPIGLVRRFDDPRDREIAAFFASALAYGNVVQIRRSVEDAFARLGPRPRAFLDRFDPRRDGGRFDGFVHRFHRGADLAALSWILSQAARARGSLEGFFADGHPSEAATIREGLDSFSRRALALDPGPWRRPAPGEGVAFFFAAPSSGSACKRLCLFLRWVVRPDDGVDLGLWSRVRPSALVLPLDAHLWRLSRCLRLTRYATPGWRAAEEATASLRRLDPDDPVRFDFALCRFGMLDRCPRPADRMKCAACPLRRPSR